MQVRPATTDDAPALAVLLTQLGYPATADAVRSRLATLMNGARDAVLVACADETVHGLAALHLVPMFHHEGYVARLTTFVVEEHARGRGVGAALLAACEQFALANDAERLEVTSGDQRADAHAFYERQGLKREGQRLTKRLRPSV